MSSNTRPAGRRGPTKVRNEDVYQAYVDLSSANPPVAATRKAVARELCVDYDIIDEHTDRLVKAGRIQPVIQGSGIFEPTEKLENRAVSFTDLPHGAAKLELGDQVLDVRNMREGWVLYGLLKGWLESKMQRRGTRIVPQGTKI